MIYTNSDGGARGNPGPGAIGVIVRDEDKILTKHSSIVGNYVTNNIAEYEVKNPKLMELFLKVQKLQENFKVVEYKHVSRWDKYQQLADELLNQELDNSGYKNNK